MKPVCHLHVANRGQQSASVRHTVAFHTSTGPQHDSASRRQYFREQTGGRHSARPVLYTAQLRASVVLILVLQVLSTAGDSAAAARFALTWAAS